MNDRVVLVTGGAGHLGRFVTRAFLQAGARVAVPFYKTDAPTALDHLATEYGDRLYMYALDLTTERGAEQTVRQAVEWGGGLHTVVHLVGGFTGGMRLAETQADTWATMIDLNLTSAYLIARFGIPRMVAGGGGTLVFTSSRSALESSPGAAAYAAAKAGLIALARAVASEYGAEGVRANVVVPDTLDTEANRRAMPDADRSRWVDPEALARVILFLSSDAANAVNGAAVPVYGSRP